MFHVKHFNSNIIAIDKIIDRQNSEKLTYVKTIFTIVGIIVK